MNPLLSLPYETAFASLGNDYYDAVEPAQFPQYQLRFRNDAVLQTHFGIDPATVSDEQWIDVFGKFASLGHPCLAMCYHGYQFGTYNPMLGDGRGFLYGQVRGLDGELYDFGTKGSGTTPYSRGGDGRLTLKGGVREIIAAETLYRMGVRTSRCLSVIETGEALWRGDEPSPTRSSVLVRFSRSHIRFGTFERLFYLKRLGQDTTPLMARLLDHVLQIYYPHLLPEHDFGYDPLAIYPLFYGELVQRTAKLAAQWMAAGFCHAVLNTDNMSITGESFDYGPFAFIPNYDRSFTAAYFDHGGRYSYGNQPGICKLNLEMLQTPLSLLIDRPAMLEALDLYDETFYHEYEACMLAKLGFRSLPEDDRQDLLSTTLSILENYQVSYGDFFAQLRSQFSPTWRDDANQILADAQPLEAFKEWRLIYHRILQTCSDQDLVEIADCLKINPLVIPTRPEIEAIWQPITEADNWQPLYDLLTRIRE